MSDGRFQVGNVAAGKHFGRSTRPILPVGQLGKSYPNIGADARRLRKELEAEVLACHGQISFGARDVINSVVRYEQAARCIQFDLRKSDLKPMERAQLLKLHVHYTTLRTNAIRRLGLHPGGPADPLESFYGDSWAAMDRMVEEEDAAKEEARLAAQTRQDSEGPTADANRAAWNALDADTEGADQ